MMNTPFPPSDQYEQVKVHALMAMHYFDVGCKKNQTPERIANMRKIHEDRYAQAVAGCKQAKGRNCDVAPSATQTTAGRDSSSTVSSQTCDWMKQTVSRTKVPPNASVTAAMETVMFMTKTAIDMIDAGCPTEPGVTRAQIAAARADYQRQYTTAEQNCNTVQSGGRRCVPQVVNANGTSTVNITPQRSSRSDTVSLSNCSAEFQDLVQVISSTRYPCNSAQECEADYRNNLLPQFNAFSPMQLEEELKASVAAENGYRTHTPNYEGATAIGIERAKQQLRGLLANQRVRVCLLRSRHQALQRK